LNDVIWPWAATQQAEVAEVSLATSIGVRGGPEAPPRLEKFQDKLRF